MIQCNITQQLKRNRAHLLTWINLSNITSNEKSKLQSHVVSFLYGAAVKVYNVNGGDKITRIVAASLEGVREGDAGTVCNTVFLQNKCGKCYIILSTFTNVEIGHQQSAPNIFNSKTRPRVLWVPGPRPFLTALPPVLEVLWAGG